jgi:hypothetical protein
MHGLHKAEGHLPGLGESLVSPARACGIVPEKFKRSMDESAALLDRYRACSGDFVLV